MQVVMRHLEWLRRYVLLVGVVGGPLIVLPSYGFEPFNVPKLALLIAVVGIAGGLRMTETALGRSAKSLALLVGPALLILTPLVVAWVAAPYKEWALFGQFPRFQGLLPYVLLAVMGVLLVDAFQDRPLRLVVSLAVTGAIVGAYTLVQMLGIDPLPWGFSEPPNESTFGNTNFSGGFMGMSLPGCVYLWFRDDRLARVGMVLALFTAAGLLFTGSQGGWAAAVAGTAIVMTAHTHPGSLRRRAGIVIAGVVALAVVGVVVASLIGWRVPGVPFETGGVRALTWETAGEMFLDSPAIGHGPNSFAIEGTRYRSVENALALGFSTPDDPHSVPLAFLANAGVLGLAGFAGVGAWAAARGRAIGEGNALGAAFLGIVIAYFVQSLVSIDEIALRLGLWVGLAGLAVTSPTRGANGEAVGRPRSRLVVATVVVVAGAVALGGAVVAWGSIAADHNVRTGSQLIAEGHVAKGRDHFEDALSWRDEADYRHVFFQRLGEEALNRGSDGVALIDEMRSVASYLEDLPKASDLFTLARIYHYWGNFMPSGDLEALALYRKGLGLDSHHIYAHIDLSEVLLDLGRAGDAVEQLRRLAPAVRETGQYAEFWGALGLALFEGGRLEAGEEALEQGRAINPNDCRVRMAEELLALRTDPEHSPNPGIPPLLRLNCGPGLYQFFLERIPPEQRADYA
jgi:O-antigen ligase